MIKSQIIKKTADYLKKSFSNEATGHDWWHIKRVWQMARQIGKMEQADMFVVEMAALLHDLGDYKAEPDRKDRQEEKIGAWLDKMKVCDPDRRLILHIILHMSYSKNLFEHHDLSLEGQIVQDADRLDAMGAIGIVRTFVYASAHHISPYIPGVKPRVFRSIKHYKHHEVSAINHFYEKLLLLKKCMNTKAAKKLAAARHEYMEKFLREFFKEWKGKL